MTAPLDKWDLRFLRVAREVAKWSKDPSTKVGAVLVSPDKKRVVLGYNGFPEGMEDRPEWYQDRNEKYSRIIHAEKNAANNALTDLKGWTQYTWPFQSCDRCFVEMAHKGIARFVAPQPSEEVKARWADSLARTKRYAEEMRRSFEEVDFPTTFEDEPSEFDTEPLATLWCEVFKQTFKRIFTGVTQ